MKSVARFRQRERVPAQLIRRCRDAVERRARAAPAAAYAHERAMHDRRTNPVQPRATIRVPRRGERRARQLLRVQAVGRALRRVLADRQRACRAPRWRTRCRSPTDTRAQCRPPSSLGRAAHGRLPDLRLRHRDRRHLSRIDAVLHRGDLGQDRDRDLRRRAAADVQADRPVQPRDLVRRSRRIRAGARGAWRCSRASRARRRRTPAT